MRGLCGRRWSSGGAAGRASRGLVPRRRGAHLTRGRATRCCCFQLDTVLHRAAWYRLTRPDAEGRAARPAAWVCWHVANMLSDYSSERSSVSLAPSASLGSLRVAKMQT